MNKGRIVQVIGPVVDVEFPDKLPAIYNAVEIHDASEKGEIHVVLEGGGHDLCCAGRMPSSSMNCVLAAGTRKPARPSPCSCRSSPSA